MKKFKKIPISNFNDSVECPKCGVNLLDIKNIRYTGKTISTPISTKEEYECRSCGNVYFINYPIFDSAGHVKAITFSEDINDPLYKWQDRLTKEQIKSVEEHLQDCLECRKKVDNEKLEEARFADSIKCLRFKEKIAA